MLGMLISNLPHLVISLIGSVWKFFMKPNLAIVILTAYAVITVLLPSANGQALMPQSSAALMAAYDLIKRRVDSISDIAGSVASTADILSSEITKSPQKTLFYALISSSMGQSLGWGDKSVIANILLGKAFITTMGFHNGYWGNGWRHHLGLPLSDEYAHAGGTKQDFELGSMYWFGSTGVRYELNPVSSSAPATTQAPVTSLSFTIASSDRVAFLTCVTVTLTFTPATPIPSGGTFTLLYPAGFFASSIAPSVSLGASSVAGLTATCGATSATSVVITTSGATIGAALFTVTIRGFTMGSSGSSVANGILIKTSSEGTLSTGVSSGPLRCPAGSYWKGQPPTCSLCPAGHYSDTVDASVCFACPAGAYCLEGCASSKGSGLCLQGTYSSAGSGTSVSCSPCPANRYCSGSSYPKFATFYWSGSSVVYYPVVTNSGRPSVSTSPLSLSFSRGNFVNLGSVSLQPGLTGFSATVAAKFTGSVQQWERLFEFARGTWDNNLILSRVWWDSTIRFDSYQTNQASYEQTAWSETSIAPLTHLAENAIVLIIIS
jgi:hypothetical protein